MGLFMIIAVAALFVRGPAIIYETAADRQIMFVWALMSLAIGIAFVLGHNKWSGGALTVGVTVVGWLVLLKGLVLLFLPTDSLMNSLQYRDHAWLYLLPATLIGVWLTFAGFTAKTSPAI
jgi:hypothetical protein